MREFQRSIVEQDLGWGNLLERQNPEVTIDVWLQNLSPSDLVAVHVTNTFPSDNCIRTHVGWSEKTGKEGAIRDTVHFTLNSTVQKEHGMKTLAQSTWVNRKFVVLLPFSGLPKNHILNTKTDDTFLLGDVDLPPGTHVLVDWHDMDALINNGIITQQEYMEMVRIMGLQDEYTHTASQPLRETNVEKGGIRYSIVDFSGEKLRERIDWEMKDMGFRRMPTDWDDEFYQSGIRGKYGLPEGVLHDNHLIINFEDLGARISNLPFSTMDSVLSEMRGYLEFEAVNENDISALFEKIFRDMMRSNQEVEEISENYSRVKCHMKRNFSHMLEQMYFRLRILRALPEFQQSKKCQEGFERLAGCVDSMFEKYAMDSPDIRSYGEQIYRLAIVRAKRILQDGLIDRDVSQDFEYFDNLLMLPTLDLVRADQREYLRRIILRGIEEAKKVFSNSTCPNIFSSIILSLDERRREIDKEDGIV